MAAGFLLALGIWFLAAPSSQSAAEDEEIKEAKEAILKILDSGDSDVKAQAEALAKKCSLEAIMNASFKPRKNGGIGVGPAKAGDGIELKVMSLSKRALPKLDLTSQEKDLTRMAQISKLVGEATQHFADKYKKPGKTPADWKKHTDDMIKGSDDLIKALKTGNPTTVKTAATDLNASCNNCHSDFRD